MSISNNTPAGDFSWHFRSLIDNDNPVRMTGCRPSQGESPPFMRPERLYDGKNVREAFELARAWNSDGYNILFQCASVKQLWDCGWLGLHVYTDSATVPMITALEHLTAMSDEEFLGSANILDSGDGFWFLIRVPDRPYKNASNSFQPMRSIRHYCTDLGIKWDLSTNDDLACCMDAIDFFPLCGMPAAGMLNHGITPPYLTTWYAYRVDVSPPGIIERVMESKDSTKILREIIRKVDESEMHKASVMDFNQGFTPDAFTRLMSKNDYLKKLVAGNHLISQKRDIIDCNLDLILFLRSHFLANPNTIASAISERIKGWPIPFSLQKCDHSKLLVAMFATDDYLKPSDNTNTDFFKLQTEERPKSLDSLLIPASYDIIPREKALIQLSARYGAQIHFARSGIYQVRFGSRPQEIMHIRDKSFHHQSYIPFACNFWIAANQDARGKGALLVPHYIARNFSSEVCRQDGYMNKILICFWRYGNIFKVLRAPREWGDETTGTVSQVVNWISLNEPATYRIWRSHRLGRERRM